MSKAVELNPKDRAAYVSRGTAYSQMGHWDNATIDYNQAIQLDPAVADGWSDAATPAP